MTGPRTRPLATPGLLILLVLLGSCDSSPVLYAPPETLQLVEGEAAHGDPGESSEVRGEVGMPLPPSTTLQLRDGAGNPVPGASVRFHILEGNGRLSREVAVSDRRGRISLETWILGEEVGRNRLSLQVVAHGGRELGNEGPRLEVTAQADPGDPAQLTPADSLLLEAEVATTLETPPGIRVEDRFGNPVPGARVGFALGTEEGTLLGTEVDADAQGLARPGQWTLGPRAGTQSLLVSVQGHAGVEGSVEVVALPGPPHALELVGALPTEGEVGVPVETDVRVRVEDRFRNGVGGVEVGLAPGAGSGSVALPQVTTGSAGEADLPEWTLGTSAGTQSLTLQVEGSDGVAPATLQLQARPGPVAELSATTPTSLVATVGELVAPAPAVRVRDRFGNPIPGVQVHFTGDGIFGNPSPVSGANGIAGVGSWRVRESVGLDVAEARLEESVEGVDPVRFEAEVVQESRTLTVVSGGGQTGVAGGAIPSPVVVVLEDEAGSPLAGVPLSLQVVAGGGSVSPSSLTTNSQGRISVTGWTLGEEPGLNRLRISGERASPVEVEATGEAPSLRLQIVRGNNQTAAPGSAVPIPPAVRVLDQLDRPRGGATVTFQVVAGGGSVTPGSVVSSGTGEAGVESWTLGAGEGTNSLEARVTTDPAPSGSTVTFQAQATEEPELGEWWIEGVHINQGNQNLVGSAAPLTGGIPLVVGRAGLLRVFLRGADPSPPGVRVRMQIRQGGSVVVDQTVSRGGDGSIEAEPIDPDAGARSWNLALPASAIQGGREVRITVDPDGVLGSPGAVTYPEGGGWAALDILSLPTFRSTFIPIHSTYYDLTGRITPGNVMSYAGSTLDLFPMAGFDFQVRTTPFVYEGSFDEPFDGWVGALQDIRDLRLAEGVMERYYHGILQRPSGAGIAGIAYVATQPSGIQNLAAVSFDELPVAGPIIAHEFGHNFGRNHAPCGGASGVDSSYPYSDGSLGWPGYSPASGSLLSSGGHRDVMGYCSPWASSDYTFDAVLSMLDARGAHMSSSSFALSASGTTASFGTTDTTSSRSLLVGGGWSVGEGAFLRPALQLEAPPSPPSPDGDVWLEVLDGEGRTLATGRYEALPVDHAEDESLRHFGVVIPVPGAPPSGPAAPARIRVRTPAGTAELTSPVAAAEGIALRGDPETDLAGPPLELQVERMGGGGAGTATFGTPPSVDHLRLRWNAAGWPVILLRKGSTGEVVGFFRSGDARFPLPLEPGEELVLQLSDGVRTRRERVRLP